LASEKISYNDNTAHDFFEPQPCRDASVFLLRALCHDWTDEFVIKILKHLRDAAQPHTKLLIGDYIVPYACPDDTEISDLPGAAKTLPPVPLLANLGRANAVVYRMDLVVSVCGTEMLNQFLILAG
jgi:hypothetical protein